MMRGLLSLGAVLCGFGLLSNRVLGEVGLFGAINLGMGALALVAGCLQSLRRIRAGAAETRAGGNLPRAFFSLAVVTVAAVSAVYLSSRSDWRFDWTFEERYSISPATLEACSALPHPPRFTLYFQSGDPRLRNTRLLLAEIARQCNGKIRTRDLEQHPADEDHFGIGSSNSVVVASGDSWAPESEWELVERPTEGALFEALRYLAKSETPHILYVSTGAGEGDLEREDELGFSGLRAALELEGYELRPLPTATIDAIPEDAAALLVLAPRRALRPSAQRALTEYLETGGSMIAMLEPEVANPLEPVLAHFGIFSRDAVVVDPDSGPVEDDAPGLSPIAYNYSDHALTHGLDRNRRTFFRRARAFQLSKVESGDKLRGVVFTSGNAWLNEDFRSLDSTSIPPKPPSARADYHPMVVAARLSRPVQADSALPREAAPSSLDAEAPASRVEARIVAFGDSDFASNRHLRTLYNLDLVLNAVHWSVRREPEITLRPKVAQLIQTAVPLQSSLKALYGAGILVPELLLIAAGLIWATRRGG